MSPYYLRFELGGLPKLPNGGHCHWRTIHEERKKWKGWVRVMAAGRTPTKPLARAKLKLTRFSSVEPDYDNLAASFKAVIDGLRMAGVILDDRSANIGTPQFSWEKCASRKGKIVVEVWEDGSSP